MATFDVIFLGGGPAGYVGAIRAAQLGLNVAVIERDGVVTNPKGLDIEQCRGWLATQYPHADLLPDASTSKAVITALEENRKAREIGAEPGTAAIASELAGEIYGLPVLFEKIEDNPENRENLSVYFNHDPGTGPIYGWYLENNAAARPIFDAWLAPAGTKPAPVTVTRPLLLAADRASTLVSRRRRRRRLTNG